MSFWRCCAGSVPSASRPSVWCPSTARTPGHRRLTQLLGDAAVDGISIMVFVGSSGCIQIHTGPASNIQPMDGKDGVRWINVLDKGFNLHLHRPDSQCLGGAKPTSDGVVTLGRGLDAEGNNMAMFFGGESPASLSCKAGAIWWQACRARPQWRRPHEHPRHFSTPGSALAGRGRGGYGPAGPGTDRRCRARSEAAGVAQRRTD